jgi:predicted ATPase
MLAAIEEDALRPKPIKLTNFLRFGETAQTVDLSSLNVVIDANGSGKVSGRV